MSKTKLYYLSLSVMWWLPGQVERRKKNDRYTNICDDYSDRHYRR